MNSGFFCKFPKNPIPLPRFVDRFDCLQPQKKMLKRLHSDGFSDLVPLLQVAASLPKKQFF